MHAYLIISSNPDISGQVDSLARKLKVKILEFPLTKIDNARDLKVFTSLKIDAPTAIYINRIDLATEEALNAFLKNLEEPQENLYYILTASSVSAVLPTIVSRCQVIKVNLDNFSNKEKVNIKNLKPTFSLIDKIKDREEAKEFIQNLIIQNHFNLLNSPENRDKTADNLEIFIKTLNNLKANGNVALQLTNMIIHLT
jgi:DNA polymerase-3 subunit delta'